MQVDQGLELDKQTVAKCYELIGKKVLARYVLKEDNFEMIKAHALLAQGLAQSLLEKVTNKLLNRGLIKGATK